MSVRPEFPNVLLLEDDPHFAAWAAAVLQRECIDLKVAIACDSPSAQRLLKSQPQGWRIAVVDLNLGADCGSGFIDYLHRVHPHLPSLVVTSVETPERALAALQAGAQGYLLKATVDSELVRMVRQVLEGASPITPSIARALLTAFRSREEPDALPPGVADKLSQREVEVLKLLARGYTDKEVAVRLGISPTTVSTHIRKIFQKLSIHSRVELRRLIR